jgi:hypothetical protein
LKNCEPSFTETEWEGSRKNKKLMKYWFIDKKGHVFYSAYDNIANGKKDCCNECGKQKQLEKQKLTENQYYNYVKVFEKDKKISIITFYKEYNNFRQKLKCKCMICNNVFEESIDNLLKKDSHGCVSISSGERIAISLFEENGIDYNYQMYIKELNLTSDFEIKLMDNSLLHLEIDGDQHYEYPNEFHKNYREFVNSKERDIKKDQWYSKKGYKNIHIRYNVGGKNNDDINLILYKIINGLYGECQRKSINPTFNIDDLLNENSKNKKIIAYTLDGKFYNVYKSILEAEKDLCVDNSSISECLNQRRNCRRSGDYIFKLFEENYPLEIPPYKNSKSKVILVYKDGILADTVNSLRELSEKYQIPKSSMSRYLNGIGGNPKNGEYDFKYA